MSCRILLRGSCAFYRCVASIVSAAIYILHCFGSKPSSIIDFDRLAVFGAKSFAYTSHVSTKIKFATACLNAGHATRSTWFEETIKVALIRRNPISWRLPRWENRFQRLCWGLWLRRLYWHASATSASSTHWTRPCVRESHCVY